MAGIKTLPICLGEIATRRLLQAMHILLHLLIAVSMLLKFVMVEILLSLYPGLPVSYIHGFFGQGIRKRNKSEKDDARMYWSMGNLSGSIYKTITDFDLC